MQLECDVYTAKDYRYARLPLATREGCTEYRLCVLAFCGNSETLLIITLNQ